MERSTSRPNAAWVLVSLVLQGTCLLNGADVIGRVVDEGGYSLPGALVIVAAYPQERTQTAFKTTTKRDGTYSLQNVPYGTYSIEASLDGFVSVRYQPLAILYPRFRRDFVLPLAPSHEGGVYTAAELIGTIRTGNAAVGGALVCLISGTKTSCVSANEIGEYQLRVDTGRYLARVMRENKVLWEQEVNLADPAEYRDVLRERQ